MFTIADRYIAREFIKYFLAALTVFTSLFLVIEVLSSIWQLNASGSKIWAYYGYQIPSIIHKMTPVSCLMATILTISILSRSNELVALFSAGVSLARASAPILALTLAIGVGSFFVADKLVPVFTKKKNYIYYVEIKKQPWFYYTVKVNKIWYRSKDLIYNIKTLNPEKNLIQGLTIYYFSPAWQLTQLVTAKEALFKNTNWLLKDGTVTLFDEQSSFPLSEKFKEKTITLDETPTDMHGIHNAQDLSMVGVGDVMTVGELQRYIRKNKEVALDTTRYEVAYFAKFSFSFVCFVMAFLGIPFSVSKERSGGFAINVGICFLLVFVYWTLVSIGLSLGNHGTVPPVLAAWGPNAIMLGVAVYFLLRLKR
ncbi:MAG: LPS export ABC transporter permease LptG [Oligoflexia bacterium]|nr:LPS export ABC transporter permease LptG [Oligoflexia bacterium]